MIVVACLGLLFAACIFLSFRLPGSVLPYMAGSICMLSGTIFMISLISVPVMREDRRASAAKFQAFADTLKKARANPKLTEMERAAFTAEVIRWNDWLAGAQHEYRKTQWSLWYPEEVNTLEMLE